MLKFLRSFGYAAKGWQFGLHERNIRVHVLAAVVVIVLGIYFSVSRVEWSLLLLSIGMVLGAEFINTAVEEVIDVIADQHKELYNKLGLPKDLLAGAVLIVAVAALLVGIIIFVPHIMTMLR
ncbi:MAG TPA: diacylglycerol kinase family protein [Candidatus Saccharimonadia bacterium]|nr:diacylglycerol kinase family protein [Candidatus Saccharimonadia bacterium]